MNVQTFVTLICVMVAFLAFYSNMSRRDKIYCTFRRPNKTSVSKFVPMKSRYVIWDKKKFDIVESCIVFEWWDKGIYMLFPQWVARLDYTYKSRFPHDPTTLRPVVISPEVRNVLNKEEWAKSYFKSSIPDKKKKESFIMQYLPWAGLIGVVLIGAWVYMNMGNINAHLTVIDNALKALGK